MRDSDLTFKCFVVFWCLSHQKICYHIWMKDTIWTNEVKKKLFSGFTIRGSPLNADMNLSLENGMKLELTCRFCLNGDPTNLISMSRPMDVFCRNKAIDLELVILVSYANLLTEFRKTNCKSKI